MGRVSAVETSSGAYMQIPPGTFLWNAGIANHQNLPVSISSRKPTAVILIMFLARALFIRNSITLAVVEIQVFIGNTIDFPCLGVVGQPRRAVPAESPIADGCFQSN